VILIAGCGLTALTFCAAHQVPKPSGGAETDGSEGRALDPENPYDVCFALSVLATAATCRGFPAQQRQNTTLRIDGDESGGITRFCVAPDKAAAGDFSWLSEPQQAEGYRSLWVPDAIARFLAALPYLPPVDGAMQPQQLWLELSCPAEREPLVQAMQAGRDMMLREVCRISYLDLKLMDFGHPHCTAKNAADGSAYIASYSPTSDWYTAKSG
jgi:hypothetical protein